MIGVRTYLTVALVGISVTSFAQFKGDDEGILMQKAALRDSVAIAEAAEVTLTPVK